MMSHTPSRPTDRDRRFAERLAEHYRPQPLDPRRRARFDAALRRRVERRAFVPGLFPALATAAAALAVAWAVWPAAAPAPEAPGGAAPSSLAGSPALWEDDAVLTDAESTLAEEAYLPDEYQVIAFAFIDGR